MRRSVCVFFLVCQSACFSALPPASMNTAKPVPGGGGDGTAGCVDPDGCRGGGTPGTPSGPGSPSSCGAMTFPITTSTVQPNVYFIVDASGSMGSSPYMVGHSKWQQLQVALRAVLEAHRGQARYGLSLYPASTGACNAGGIDVPIGPDAEDAILARVEGITTAMIDAAGGATPTAVTVEAALALSALRDPDRPSYVILLTDGAPNCESTSYPGGREPVEHTTAAIAALAALTPSIKTFVIGLGDVTSSLPAALNEFAVAGQTARPGTTKFYPATDALQLEQAFDQVVGATASCTYRLDAPPADPTLVAPTLDGMPVLRNPSNGFSYDEAEQAVHFHGATCDRIKSGAVSRVEVTYGCPPIEVL
jgi:hypothetical protein